MPAKKIGKILFACGIFMLILAIVLLITIGNVVWFITLCLSIILNIAGVNLLLFKSKQTDDENE